MQTSYRNFIRSNIFNNGYLRNILIVSILLVTVLPVYNFLVISPLFSKFLAESTNNTAVRVAKHFASTFGQNNTVLNKDHIKFDESSDINDLRSDFRLTKLKIFSDSGEVLFSTDPEDIGSTNTQRYFHEVVAKGNIVTKGITKETESLEGELMPVDVVETYVPVMSGENFIGAFEIYYDITAEKQQLNKMLTRSSVLVFSIALGLLIASMVILFIEKKIIYKRKHMQKEREKLIADLQDAIAKVNTLKGMLPICANCKKIRDDKGRWEQIESYIREHSEAELTHGICPECVKKLYPDL